MNDGVPLISVTNGAADTTDTWYRYLEPGQLPAVTETITETSPTIYRFL